MDFQLDIPHEIWALNDDRLPRNSELKRTKPDETFIDSVKTFGQLQPIGIGYNRADGYMFIFGRKRLLALRDLFEQGLGPNKVKVYFYDGISKREVAELTLIENAQRSDNPIADALAIDDILRSDSGATFKSIAETIGKTVTYVKKAYEHYMSCPKWTLLAVLDNKMAITTAFAVSKLGKDTQEQLKKQFKKNGKLTGAEVHDSRRAMQVASYAELIPQSIYNMDVKRNKFTRAELEQIRSLEELKELLR